MRRFLVALLCAPIRAYRLVVSPLMPSSCRFTPSCSHYALDALHQHGPVTGVWLTLKRLARCHPITWLGGSSGFDPVPLSKRPIQS
ncbi:MAG TPA: membrane protein insertion efficiency factor YidD [Rhizomicrobium sp.]|nr:membrane protein insertion efficiency factor YidD [Rhizomicrobium sp.]